MNKKKKILGWTLLLMLLLSACRSAEKENAMQALSQDELGCVVGQSRTLRPGIQIPV
ncbi:hypothetical protein KFU94_27370 [Chloroflexi bacterium TSY]|nr:hypothetical protein [Chloroflexi bacterium TSY]